MGKQVIFHRQVRDNVKAIDCLDPTTGEHLIPKFESFCIDYAQHFNPHLALEAAGYPMEGKTKKQIDRAFRGVMQREDIRMRVKALIRQKVEHSGVGTDWVVLKWMQIIDRCMQADPVLDNEGEPTGEWKFDSRGAGNALHDMAAYYGMFQKAMTDSKPVNIKVSFGPKEKPLIDGEAEVIQDG